MESAGGGDISLHNALSIADNSLKYVSCCFADVRAVKFLPTVLAKFSSVRACACEYQINPICCSNGSAKHSGSWRYSRVNSLGFLIIVSFDPIQNDRFANLA